MSDGGNSPSLGDVISNWLGFQLPAISMPNAIKNLDKAVAKILLAAGENAEARIKANTGKAKVKGKIAIEGLYRTEEERRKIENRAAAVQIAAEELSAGGASTADAHAEIDDDWLNLFARLAEDKSSEELQGLFGRILAGEIRKPGSFSLRTIQFISTLSKEDAQAVSEFLSYALSDSFVPLLDGKLELGPNTSKRALLQEMGLASHPNAIGGLAWNLQIPPKQKVLLAGTGLGIVIDNGSDHALKLSISCQVLTTPARELIKIANLGPTDLVFLKAVAQDCFEKIRSQQADLLLGGTINILVARLIPIGEQFHFVSIHKAQMPSQQQ